MPDFDASAHVVSPAGAAFGWDQGLLWTHVASDLLIAAAYLTIPFGLFHIVRRRKDLPFDWPIAFFALFVIACAVTFALDAWNVWHTHHWLEAIVKAVTAAISVPTAVLLWRALPDILSLPSQRQLREMNESLARANRELEAFTASVSHDLRSPLTTIAGQAGLLELSLTQPTEEQKRRLTRIQGSVKQMSELIDALLVLSRISRHTLRREIVDVSALCESILTELRQADPTRHVSVQIQPNLSVHGDRRLIADLFANLLNNAWKFTAKTAEPRIEVGQSSQQGSIATLYVRDNGAGFDMAHGQKLFQPFQRLHGPNEFEGSGVGLATVARIVERHGGRIWAEARPNEGAVFYFTLPTTPVTAEIFAAPPAAQ